MIYNNIGEYNGHSGRLFVSYSLDSNPKIEWDFESLTERWDNFHIFINGGKTKVSGLNLELDNVRSFNFGEMSGNGVAGRLRQGEYKERFQVWRAFYLNAFCETSNELRKYWKWSYDENGKKTRFEHTSVEIKYKSNWRISISTPKHKISEMETRQGGDYTVTTSISLNSSTAKLGIKFEEALVIFKSLTFMIQFCSGGYTFPAIIEAYGIRGSNVKHTANFYSSGRATRITEFQKTWFFRNSDLGSYIRGIKRIDIIQESEENWTDLNTCLAWYIQSIQNKEMPIAVNALGAGLEKIAFLYLVKLAKIVTSAEWKSKSAFDARIFLLCFHLGTIRSINKENIRNFMHLRNNATHAERITEVSDKGAAFREALFVFEEAMLSICGYEGEYYDRTNGEEVKIPRYSILDIE